MSQQGLDDTVNSLLLEAGYLLTCTNGDEDDITLLRVCIFLPADIGGLA